MVVWGVGKVRGRNYRFRELLEVMAIFIMVMVTPRSSPLSAVYFLQFQLPEVTEV